jgi:hypothetical protein
VALERAYIVDEPERHLHPLMQRQLAPWLGHLVWAGLAQAIIATHSIPFLNIGSSEDTSWIYLRRSADGRTMVEAVDAPTLNALSEAALDLGWDRGQLLALVGVLLFVEGRGDQAVLATLLGDELHRYGIAVVPRYATFYTATNPRSASNKRSARSNARATHNNNACQQTAGPPNYGPPPRAQTATSAPEHTPPERHAAGI